MMFGDNDNTRSLVDFLLEMYDFDELLELNDLTEEEVLAYLLEAGLVAQPRSVIESYEENETEAD